MVMVLTIIFMKNTNFTLTTMLVTLMFNLSLQTNMNAKHSYTLSSDTISFWITSMSLMTFLTLTMIKQKNTNMYSNASTTMMLILMLAFNNWNFLMFYIMFEMSMIVILTIIISWSYQPERTEAMMFMIIMTMMFSLPFLTALMLNKKSLNFWFMNMNLHLITFMSFMFIFMVKMPVYSMHFWLTKVHVEAPVHGSMILAAILLKLGCYGMMRMNKTISNFSSMKPIIMSMGIMSMIILSATCLVQTDMKTLIAYSSIVHMSMVFMNIFIMKTKSMFSSMMIIVGHGLCAATMFFMANMMYENSKSRSILLNKGILNLMPAMTLLWFATCMNNAPMPPSMNMMGELMSFKNLVSWSNLMYTPVFLAALVSSTYSIYLFYVPSHGSFSKMMNKKKLSTPKQSIITMTMLTPITTITAKPAMMMM